MKYWCHLQTGADNRLPQRLRAIELVCLFVWAGQIRWRRFIKAALLELVLLLPLAPTSRSTLLAKEPTEGREGKTRP